MHPAQYIRKYDDRLRDLYGASNRDLFIARLSARFFSVTIIVITGSLGSFLWFHDMLGPTTTWFSVLMLGAFATVEVYGLWTLLRGDLVKARTTLTLIGGVLVSAAIMLTGGFPMSPASPMVLMTAILTLTLHSPNSAIIGTLAYPFVLVIVQYAFMGAHIDIPDFTSVDTPMLNTIIVLGTVYGLAVLLLYSLVRENEELRSKLEAEHSKIHRISETDPLTGLGNRRHFDAVVEAHIANKTKKHFALLYCDLDGFKAINDKYGHKAGDHVLAEVGARIKGCLRNDDTIARLGGDEFACVMEFGQNKSRLARAEENIRQAVMTPIDFEGHRFFVGASIGMAIFREDAESLRELMHVADSRMYADKAQKHERLNEAIRVNMAPRLIAA